MGRDQTEKTPTTEHSHYSPPILQQKTDLDKILKILFQKMDKKITQRRIDIEEQRKLFLNEEFSTKWKTLPTQWIDLVYRTSLNYTKTGIRKSILNDHYKIVR